MAYKFPKNEVLWVTYYKDDEPKFFITSSPMRDVYFLYEAESGKLKKLGKETSPMILEEKFSIREKIAQGK